MSSKALPEVVIVGGGTAGLEIYTTLGKKLDTLPQSSKFKLTLITDRKYYVHLIGGIRTVVSDADNLERRTIVPLKEPTGENKNLVIGIVVSIEEDEGAQSGRVVLESGEKVPYSILVLATGSSWEGGGPWANFKGSHEDTLEKVRKQREAYEKAQHIVIVGGGAVGYETAGEIRDAWPTSKSVTLVHSGKALLNDTYPAGWRVKIGKRLAARNVNLVLNDYVDDPVVKDGSVTTRNGVKIEADLVIQARGTGRPNTNYVKQAFGDDSLSNKGLVKVLPSLQLAKHPRIFAAGDIVDWDEQKQAMKATAHAGVVINNVLVLLGQASKNKVYKTAFEMVVVTNGKSRGSAYMGVLWGLTFGDRLVSLIKSKGLFIDMYASKLGLTQS